MGNGKLHVLDIAAPGGALTCLTDSETDITELRRLAHLRRAACARLRLWRECVVMEPQLLFKEGLNHANDSSLINCL